MKKIQLQNLVKVPVLALEYNAKGNRCHVVLTDPGVGTFLAAQDAARSARRQIRRGIGLKRAKK